MANAHIPIHNINYLKDLQFSRKYYWQANIKFSDFSQYTCTPHTEDVFHTKTARCSPGSEWPLLDSYTINKCLIALYKCKVQRFKVKLQGFMYSYPENVNTLL